MGCQGSCSPRVWYEAQQLHGTFMTLRIRPPSARARLWLAAFMLLALFSSPLAAQSGFSNLRVIPNPAPANTLVVARMFEGGCQRRPTQVDVQGHQVRLTAVGGPVACFPTSPPPSDFDVPLGTFSPGTYTLTVPVFQGSADVLSTTFVVLADATPIPVANHPATLAALAVGMMLLTTFASRRR